MNFQINKAAVVKVERLDDFDDEYVYDIGVDNHTPYVFGNNILIHNSSYFSAYEYLKNDPDYADFEWSRENIIDLYDGIAEAANQTFPDFMQTYFNTTIDRGNLIKAGRELVASKGLFIKKKKYAVLIYDLEGGRKDIGESGEVLPGKLKAMGLDLKRADTPKFMQIFLEKLLLDVLQDANQNLMYKAIKDFRIAFTHRPGWEKGSPKKISNITKFVNLIDKANAISIYDRGDKHRIVMSGHARASINWNNLCKMHKDLYSMRITDGMRIIVCKLKSNSMKIDSVAYPIDEPHIPKWFKELPFDDSIMEEIIIDKKITNLVGVLKWDLSKTKDIPGDEFFSFSEVIKAADVIDEDEDEDDD